MMQTILLLFFSSLFSFSSIRWVERARTRAFAMQLFVDMKNSWRDHVAFEFFLLLFFFIRWAATACDCTALKWRSDEWHEQFIRCYRSRFIWNYFFFFIFSSLSHSLSLFFLSCFVSHTSDKWKCRKSWLSWILTDNSYEMCFFLLLLFRLFREQCVVAFLFVMRECVEWISASLSEMIFHFNWVVCLHSNQFNFFIVFCSFHFVFSWGKRDRNKDCSSSIEKVVIVVIVMRACVYSLFQTINQNSRQPKSSVPFNQMHRLASNFIFGVRFGNVIGHRAKRWTPVAFTEKTVFRKMKSFSRQIYWPRKIDFYRIVQMTCFDHIWRTALSLVLVAIVCVIGATDTPTSTE